MSTETGETQIRPQNENILYDSTVLAETELACGIEWQKCLQGILLRLLASRRLLQRLFLTTYLEPDLESYGTSTTDFIVSSDEDSILYTLSFPNFEFPRGGPPVSMAFVLNSKRNIYIPSLRFQPFPCSSSHVRGRSRSRSQPHGKEHVREEMIAH